MAITRPAPPVTIGYAEINDDLGVDVGINLGSGLVSRPFTPAEAFHLADEIRDAATEAARLAAEEVSA